MKGNVVRRSCASSVNALVPLLRSKLIRRDLKPYVEKQLPQQIDPNLLEKQQKHEDVAKVLPHLLSLRG
jgi:hypothetical protein